MIPPDPYDVFSRMHGLSSLAPYDETFKPTAEARLYLKQAMISPLRIPKSERVVWDNDCKLYYLLIEFVVKKFQLICLHIDGRDLPSRQPVFVALSRKSRQSTSNLGSKKPPHSSGLYCDLLKSQKIEPIPVEEIEDPPLSIDNILYDCS